MSLMVFGRWLYSEQFTFITFYTTEQLRVQGLAEILTAELPLPSTP